MVRPVIRVLYIGGSGRSGSTLVDRLVGQIPGFVSTGEIRDVWRAGVGENRLCGCGREFSDCPFWQRVGREAFDGWGTVDRDKAQRLVEEFGYAAALRGLGSPRRVRRRHAALTDLLKRLYTGIAVASGGATIIDSSKGPPYAVALRSIPALDFRAIHLVRDSRGVAYSWSKELVRPDTPGRDVQMHRIGAIGVAARWIAHNAMMELLGRRAPVARMRYESFVADPGTEVPATLGRVGWPVDADALTFVRDSRVTLAANHTVMGNPMRMATGEIPLRVDDAWRTALPAPQRRLVTTITLPMLVRYGYSP